MTTSAERLKTQVVRSKPLKIPDAPPVPVPGCDDPEFLHTTAVAIALFGRGCRLRMKLVSMPGIVRTVNFNAS